MGNAEQLTRAEIKRRIQSGPVTATETWYAREALLLAECDTAHARIAELEAVLRDWVEAHDASEELGEMAYFDKTAACAYRAKALMEGKS